MQKFLMAQLFFIFFLMKMLKLLMTTATIFFLPWTESVLQNCDRIDIVFFTEKGVSRKNRRKKMKGIRRKVSGKAKLPSNFKDFLRDSNNKQELCEFLTQKVNDKDYSSGKQLYITSGIFYKF